MVGNELQPQNNGNLFEYELSNGIKWNGLSSNVSDFTAYDINSNDNGTINGASWLIGRPEGEQLYEWGYNAYDYFNSVNTKVEIPLTEDISNSTFNVDFIPYTFQTNKFILNAQDPFGENIGFQLYFQSTSNNRLALVVYNTSGALFSYKIDGLRLGALCNVEISNISQTSADFKVNGNLITEAGSNIGGFVGAINNLFIGTRANSGSPHFFQGLILNASINGTNYNTDTLLAWWY